MLRSFEPEALVHLGEQPSAPYSMTIDQLRTLLAAVGEEEPILDALALAEGQSDEARAELLGVTVEDIRGGGAA